MAPSLDRLLDLLRDGVLDSELAALLWILAEGGVPIHVATADGDGARRIADGLEDLVRPVRVIAGASLEEVLAGTTGEPALLGVVVVVRDGRVSAAHWLRPSLRDGAGHLRPQGPAVLATFDPVTGQFEHYSWGVIPELASLVGRKAGDFEIEHRARGERFDRLVGSSTGDRPLA